jgi:hypothetical protein
MSKVANIIVKSESGKGIIRQEGSIVQLESGVETQKVSIQLSDNMHSIITNTKITIQSIENIQLHINILDCRNEIGRTVHQITPNSL